MNSIQNYGMTNYQVGFQAQGNKELKTLVSRITDKCGKQSQLAELLRNIKFTESEIVNTQREISGPDFYRYDPIFTLQYLGMCKDKLAELKAQYEKLAPKALLSSK